MRRPSGELTAPESAFADAVAYHRAGNAAAAKRSCFIAAVASSDPAPARLLALLLAEDGARQEALAWIERAIALDAAAAPSHTALGRILALGGDWHGAADAFRAAIGRAPTMVVAHDGLGRALLALGRAPEACRSYDTALRLHRTDPALRRSYAAALLADPEPGMALALRAAADFPEVPEIQQACGQLLFGRRLWDQAVDAFARAAAEMPGDASVRHDLGTALHEAGRPEDAIGAYREALAIDPDRPATWHNLGSLRQMVGDLQGAYAAYAQAYRRDPASFPRIAQELAAGRHGEVYLRAADLRRKLEGCIGG